MAVLRQVCRNQTLARCAEPMTGGRIFARSRLRRSVGPCAIPSTVIGLAHRQEFGLQRNRPDASLLLRARWIARTRRRFGAANNRSNHHDVLDQEATTGAVHRRIFAALT